MLLRCDTSAADGYTSQAQKSRVLSEAWFQSNGYCLSCDNDRLLATAVNTKARDFVCPSCKHNYELKAFRTRPKRTLVDGAYSALMSRILDGSVPTLMMLERNDAWEIQSLTAIHHLFLTPNIIEQREPLSPTARRAGWVGCNIRLDLISPDAQVAIVGKGRVNEPKLVRETFRRFEQLRIIEPSNRGWATLTLKVIRNLGRRVFKLDDLYEQEKQFAAVYPGNRHIRAKIRQQLQVLRDLELIAFHGGGTYDLLT
jgi:type II restriction enzyme